MSPVVDLKSAVTTYYHLQRFVCQGPFRHCQSMEYLIVQSNVYVKAIIVEHLLASLFVDALLQLRGSVAHTCCPERLHVVSPCLIRCTRGIRGK